MIRNEVEVVIKHMYAISLLKHLNEFLPKSGFILLIRRQVKLRSSRNEILNVVEDLGTRQMALIRILEVITANVNGGEIAWQNVDNEFCDIKNIRSEMNVI
jgi:hypothetical protein